MEKKIRFLWENFLWAAVLVPIVMSTNSTTNIPPQTTGDFIHDAYAWTSWGDWSPCSKSCGGGVSVQERQCLPRRIHAVPSSVVNGTLPPPVITVRVTRQTHQQDCLGVSKRYHQCNNSPCPGGIKSSRTEQCAAFDRRPFKGRFYTWVPYIDGDAPCTLNCRPLGQHFYASLSLVADGTPCTRPGLNAICIQGACKGEIMFITVHFAGGETCALTLKRLTPAPRLAGMRERSVITATHYSSSRHTTILITVRDVKAMKIDF